MEDNLQSQDLGTHIDPLKGGIPWKNISFVIHVGSSCNFRCDYCYYNHPPGRNIISRPELQTMFKRISNFASKSLEGCKIMFIREGEEPLLAGKSFYHYLVNTQKDILPPSIKVKNLVQTNGSLIDDEFAKFFSQSDFGVGVSFNGTPETHDLHCKDVDGNPTSSIVLSGMRTLRNYGVIFCINSIITDEMVGQEEEIYRFQKSLGIRSVSFEPVIGLKDSINSLSPDKYLEFLTQMFKIWTGKLGPIPEVKPLKTLLRKILGFKYDRVNLYIERNGDVHYFDDYNLRRLSHMGNIYTDELSSIFAKAKVYQQQLIEERRRFCKNCRWVGICETGGPQKFYCSAYQRILPLIKDFADEIRPNIPKEVLNHEG